MSLSPSEAYSVLGIPNGSSREEVRSAFKQVARQTHPDKNREDPDATARFQRVQSAYETLMKHLDPSESDDEDGFYEVYDMEELIRIFVFEEIFLPRYGRRPPPRARRETSEEREERTRRARQEQAAAAERRKREAAARRERAEQDRERERKAAEQRQKAKAQGKKNKAEAQRIKAEQAAHALKRDSQNKRTAVFAAAHLNETAKVKKGIWEENVDAAGGEVKPGCDEFVEKLPEDPLETLLHIAAQHNNASLIEWLDDHGADPEERNTQGYTALHVALLHGRIEVVSYFFRAYPPKDAESMYQLSPSGDLLSLAVQSLEPQLVWMVLENGLAQSQDIHNAWTYVTSQSVQQSAQAKNSEKFEDLVKLLTQYGGFTPPPTPQVKKQEWETQEPRKPLSQTKPRPDGAPVEQGKGVFADKTPSRGGRGRGRGYGRGRGRGRGQFPATQASR